MSASLDLHDIASTSPLAMRELERFREVESAARALIAKLCRGCPAKFFGYNGTCHKTNGCQTLKALREALDKEAT